MNGRRTAPGQLCICSHMSHPLSSISSLMPILSHTCIPLCIHLRTVQNTNIRRTARTCIDRLPDRYVFWRTERQTDSHTDKQTRQTILPIANSNHPFPGPLYWHEIFPEDCSGKYQSPIDIHPEETVYNPELKDFAIWYDPPKKNSKMYIANNGHTGMAHAVV